MDIKETKKTKRIKLLLNLLTSLALLVLIFVSRHAIVDAFSKLGQLDTFSLLLMIPLQFLGYYAVGRLYGDFFKARGEALKPKTAFKIAMELNFVNHVFPSGGVSGFSYLSLRLKKEGIGTAQSTLAQLLRFALTFISFLLLLVFGLFVLALRRKTNPLTILIASSVMFLTIFGVLLSIYIISDSNRIKAFVRWLPRFVNRVVGLFRKSKKDTISITKVEKTLDEMHRDYMSLMADKSALKRPFMWALLINITEILTIYSAYVAFGEYINPGGLIIAYAIANLAGLVAILPGGVGVYEGLMTAVMTASGVDKALALSATVVYRVITMLIGLPIGYYFYHRNMNNRQIYELEKDIESHEEV